jgi:hypothetical protein
MEQVEGKDVAEECKNRWMAETRTVSVRARMVGLNTSHSQTMELRW